MPRMKFGTDAERTVPNPEDPAGPLVPADEDTLVQEMVALLSAFRRFSGGQIAIALHIPAERVVELQAQPAVQEMAEALRAILPRPGELNELLMSDAERNIRWLRGLREGRVDGEKLGTDAKMLRVRSRAAEVLFDRQVAKKAEPHSAPSRIIDISDVQLTRMRKLLGPPDDEGEKST
jgi:hypothetical protein